MRLERKYKVRHGHLPLAALITHPQMRVTVNAEGIEQLADNIYHHGLIHPICVADTEDGYIVISGHRRLRACRLLEERGYRMEDLAVIIFEKLTSIEMALLQASENIHEQVPPQEAAKFYEATWRLLKMHEPAFTLADFARAVGRNEQTIRNALRFSLLPQRIQEFVQSSSLSYGAAVHLARLRDMLSDEALERWAIRAIISRLKVPEFGEQVDTFIHDVSSGQLNMLDLFEENVRRTLEQDSRRVLIDRATIVSFWSGITYLKRLLFLFENGKLELQDSPWLRRNPKRAFLELIDAERRILKHMKIVLVSGEAEGVEHILKECEGVLLANSS